MPVLTRRSRTTPIGLDIGEQTARAAQLKGGPGRWVLSRVACCDRRPLGAGADESRLADEVLRNGLALAEFRGRRIWASLSTPDIELHALELPATVAAGQPVELARIVRWEVERLTTIPHHGIETGYWALPTTQAPAPNAIGVAALQEKVVETVQACAAAGYVCTGVDAAATALCRFGGVLNRWDPNVVWGILDLGFRQTRLVLSVEDVPVLVRIVGVGGGAWTDRIAESLRISTKAAEVQKRDVGIALTGRGLRADATPPPAIELGSVLKGILRSDLHDVAAEVKRSYEYVLSCYSGRRAADLVLVGGGAATLNLPEYLTDELGIPVRRASAYLDGDTCRLRYVCRGHHRFEELALATGLVVQG